MSSCSLAQVYRQTDPALNLKPTMFQSPSSRLLCSRCCRLARAKLHLKRFLFSRPRSKVFESKTLEALESLNQLSKTPKPVSPALGSIPNSQIKWKTPKKSEPSSSPDENSSEGVKLFNPQAPHHIHVYSTHHNCHITFSDGNRNPLISVSAGNIGFRKGARGTFDAAYKLSAYVLARIRHQRLADRVQQIELILRDFGPGRDAFSKVLLGNEGISIRDKIVRVMDATRLKFGGTRAKKPRRL